MFRPTFATGYALEPGDSMFPELWHGLVGAWCPSMGKQGSNLFDFSPYKHHATLNNMDASTDYVPGKFGSALNYDGTDDFLDMGNIPEIADASNDLTFIFSIKTTTSGGNRAVFSYDIDNALSPAIDIYCYFATSGNVHIGGIGDGAEWNTGYAQSNITDGEWHNVAIVLNGASEYLYVDSVIVASRSVAHNHANYGATHNFRVADDSNVGHYAGDISDFFLYNRALRPEEIQMMYAGASPLSSQPLSITARSPLSVEEQSVSENIDLTESVITNVSLVKQSVTENVNLTEHISKSLARAVEEFIDLSETIQSARAITAVIEENLQLTESVSKSLTKDIIESLDLTETVDASPSDFETSISEGISLTEDVTVVVAQEASFASKIIHYNPLIFVTDTDPAKIVEVDVSDPENPVHIVTTLVGTKNAKDVAVNTQTGFLFVACADGIVVKVDITDFSVQTIIDLSDTDDLQKIDTLPLLALAYTSTDNTTGELYLIDERESQLGDLRLDVLSTVSVFGDFQGNAVEAQKMDSDFNVLAIVESGIMNTDFKCLTNVLENITPIKRTDFDVKINGTSLDSVDLLLDSIKIVHTIGEQSEAEFTLSRKHDQLDIDLAGNSSQITNQNAVVITIQGNTEFSGKVSNISASYTEDNEFVVVTALGDEKTNQSNNILLSLPSINERLGLYDILLQNPNIFNPFIDPNEEDPEKFKGVKVQLGQKREQSFARYTVFDSFGSIAESIQDGTFVPRQNWTYFWGPTVKKFGDIQLGETSAITFLYIGTSLAPVTEDLWQLTNAKHRRQRQYDDIITELGEYTVGEAPFKEISVRNGVFIPKFHWVDDNDALRSVKEAGFNYEQFAKDVADLEYQKLLNINAPILPETRAEIVTTIDSYFYHAISLLTKINVDNTTQANIYNNSNGFPLSVKSITIDSNTMKTTMTTDNLKSTEELEEINGQFPDEDDEEYNTPAQSIFITGKTNMKNKLAVS